MEEIEEKLNGLREEEFDVTKQPEEINDDNEKYQVQQPQSQMPQQPQDVEQSPQEENIEHGIRIHIPPIIKDEKEEEKVEEKVEEKKEEKEEEKVEEKEKEKVEEKEEEKEEEKVEEKEEKKECKCHDVSDIKETVEKLLENLKSIKNSVLVDTERIKDIVSDYKISNSEQDYLDNINLKLTGDYSSETDDINDELRNILDKLNNECNSENEANDIKSFIQKKYSRIVNQLL